MPYTVTQPSRFLDRIPAKLRPPAWLAWLVLCLAVSWRPLLWHIDYFSSPGPRFRTLILIFLPLLAAAALGYRYLRPRGLWRWEGRVFAGAAAAMALIFEPLATLLAVWILAACFSAGSALRSRLELDPVSDTEDVALSTGIGLAILLPALFLLGYIKLIHPFLFAVLLAVPCALFYDQLVRIPPMLRRLDRDWIEAQRPNDSLAALMVVMGAVFLAMPLMVLLSPSIASDALVHHIPIIRAFVEQRSVQPIPAIDYSYHPQAIETLMAAAYSLTGLAGAQMINPLLFALTILLAYVTARRCGLERFPALAGVFFAFTIPFLHWDGSIIKNDYGWAFFQLGCLYCLLRSRESQNVNWLQVGVWFIATSFSIKHVAIFGAIPLGIFYFWAAIRRRRGRFQLLAELAAIFVVFGLYWHWQTYSLKGNPVYPQGVDIAVEAQGGFDRQTPSRLRQYLTFPWVVHFEGWKTFESPTANPSGLFLFLFAPVWLFLRQERRQAGEGFCLLFVGIYYIYWIYVLGLIRFAIVPFVLLGVLTGGRLAEWHRQERSWVRASIDAAALYSLLFGMLVAMILEVNAPQLRLFTLQIDKKQFLREALPTTYPSVEFLQRESKPGDWVVSVGNCLRAYAPEPTRFLCLWREGAPREPIETVARELARQNVSWIILPVEADEDLRPLVEQNHQFDVAYEDAYFRVLRTRPKL